MDSQGALRWLVAAAVAAAWLLSFAGTAHAIEDGGWAETPTNLAIRPDPVDAWEGTVDWQVPIMFVQMPVTKEIRSAELGDLRTSQYCSDPVRADLIIEEHRDGEPFGSPDRSVTSTATVTLPSSAGKVKWNVPTMQLRKGYGYAFRVVPRTDLGCWQARFTTWAHKSAVVHGGTNGCTRSATGLAWNNPRMWHAYGQSDAGACPVYDFDPSMPTGWIAMWPDPHVAGRYRVIRRMSEDPVAPNVPCVTDGGGWQYGGRWRYWRAEPGNTGRHEFVCTWDQYLEPWATAANTGYGWHYAVPWPANGADRKGQPRDMHLILETIDYGPWIRAYAPTMRYGQFENYFADAVESMTDWEQNRLIRETGDDETVMADHDAASTPALLNIGLLGYDYAPILAGTFGKPRKEEDKFVQGGDPQEAVNDARQSGNADRMYGRAVYGSDGKLWIQYWFFYYFNDFVPLLGTHQGDWEMIQVRMKDDRSGPDVVAYATHNNGERCTFASVTEANPSSPVVYVGEGSHASYMESGVTYQYGVEDYHFGDRATSPQPSLDVVTGEIANFWGWPGRWGDEESDPDPSPIAPREQSKWNDPTGFYNDAEACDELQGARRRPLRRPLKTRSLPVPRILAATRTRTHARVSYAIPPRRGSRERLYVHVTVQPRNPRNPSMSEHRRLRPGRHTVRVRLPLGGGPYRVEARVIDRRNRYGRTTAATLR